MSNVRNECESMKRHPYWRMRTCKSCVFNMKSESFSKCLEFMFADLPTVPLPNLKIAQLEHSPCKLLLVLRRPESGHLRKRIWNPQRTEARQNLLDEFSSQKEVFFKHRNGRKTGCFWKRLKWQVDRSWDFKEKVGYWLLKGLQLKYCMKYCINTIYSVWIQEIQEKNDKMGGSQQSKIFQAKEKPNE